MVELSTFFLHFAILGSIFLILLQWTFVTFIVRKIVTLLKMCIKSCKEKWRLAGYVTIYKSDSLWSYFYLQNENVELDTFERPFYYKIYSKFSEITCEKLWFSYV